MSTMQFWLQLKLNAGYAQPLWCISGMADGQESEVELGFQHYIYFATTGKKWLIPSPLIKDSGDHKWLQIVTANYGLCNLLTEGSVGKQPTLKGSKGLSELLGMRAQKMSSQFQANDLFEEDAESSKTAKRRKKASTVDGAESITLELPDFGSLLIRACKKRLKICILFTLLKMLVCFANGCMPRVLMVIMTKEGHTPKLASMPKVARKIKRIDHTDS